MPDEFLCSGESLVQNLVLGFDSARSFGVEPMKYGYACDIFGHIAQLPQILDGFNIKGALLGRGTNAETCPAHFIWQSPDGSRCITFKVPEVCGYGTFWYDVFFYPILTGTDNGWDGMISRAKEYVEKEKLRSPVPYVVLMDSMDHQPIHPEAPEIAKELEKIFKCPAEFGAPDGILAELESYTGEMPVLKGELRETGKAMEEFNRLIPHTLSSRYDIKQAHDRCQNLMERRVGPLAVLAHLRGSPPPGEYFTRIGKILAQCQAHDSICGCSIDQVCRDVLYRLGQIEIMANEIINFCTCAETDSNGKGEDIKLVFCNTESEPWSSVTSASIDFPLEYPARYERLLPYEPNNMFTIRDAKGKEIPYQLLDIEKELFTGLPGGYYREKRDRYHIALEAEVGPMGVKEYRVCPCDKPVRNTGTLLSAPNCMENSHLRVEISPQGFLNITDKQTGRVYQNLLRFRDYGEIGDGWNHQPPPGNPFTVDQGSNSALRIYRDGSEICIMEITKYLSSNDAGKVKITGLISLAKTSRWVDINLVIDNTAIDHKMTVSFPTGMNTDTYDTDQAFAIVSRKAGIHHETSSWKECDRGAHAFSGLVMRRDKNGEGLAFLSTGGMHECVAHTDTEGTLEITLFRSFGRTFLTNGEPEGQLLKKLEFNFALLPLGSRDSGGSILKIRNHYINPPLNYTFCVSVPAPIVSQMPENEIHGFCLNSNNIVLSSLHLSREKNFYRIRLVNYSEAEEEAALLCPFPIAEAFSANLMEEKIQAVPFSGNELRRRLAPHKIATLLVRLSL